MLAPPWKVGAPWRNPGSAADYAILFIHVNSALYNQTDSLIRMPKLVVIPSTVMCLNLQRVLFTAGKARGTIFTGVVEYFLF